MTLPFASALVERAIYVQAGIGRWSLHGVWWLDARAARARTYRRRARPSAPSPARACAADRCYHLILSSTRVFTMENKLALSEKSFRQHIG